MPPAAGSASCGDAEWEPGADGAGDTPGLRGGSATVVFLGDSIGIAGGEYAGAADGCLLDVIC